METYIKISNLNDFIFCPKSIYFHDLYNKYSSSNYHQKPQKKWKINHKSIDTQTYTTSKNVLQWITVYSTTYKLLGKIDIFDIDKWILIERKTKITKIYTWYKYQLWAQYFCLQDTWYNVQKLKLYSLEDNKSYNIPIPTEQETEKFNQLINRYKSFDPVSSHIKPNPAKCKMCVYNQLCDIAVLYDDQIAETIK